MSDKTTVETIDSEMKHNFNLLHIFNNKTLSYVYDFDEIYSYYPLKHEYTFDYSLFKLYCFFDYSVDDIYKLLRKLAVKYPKSDLNSLEYSDFVNYAKVMKFEYRKSVYEKSLASYQNKIHNKKSADADNINFLIDDYDSTNNIIESLNSDMLFICNNEDIAAEKRIEYFDKYSKISIRLCEKRNELIEKIRAEKL